MAAEVFTGHKASASEVDNHAGTTVGLVRSGGSGGSRDRGDLRALAGSPVGLECLPGLKSTTANLS